MTVQVKTLSAWAQTRSTLVDDLTLTLGVLQNAPFSEDPASEYQIAQATQTHILASLHRHAVVGLEQIDAAIVAGPLVAQIAALSAAAAHETDRIAAITHTIADIASAVNMVSAVMDKFAALVV